MREADEETLIITNGFSCREQIAGATDRRALHIAEVLRMAMDTSLLAADGPAEQLIARQRTLTQRRTNQRAATVAGAVAVGGLLLWRLNRRREYNRL